MYLKMNVKDIVRKVDNASNVMTRSCYLSARGEVRNIVAGQICHSHMFTSSI